MQTTLQSAQVPTSVPAGVQVLSEHQGSISIKDLSERTCIRVDDVVKTLTHLQLIQVQKGVHVLYAGPSIIARCVCACMRAYACGRREHASVCAWGRESACICTGRICRYICVCGGERGGERVRVPLICQTNDCSRVCTCSASHWGAWAQCTAPLRSPVCWQALEDGWVCGDASRSLEDCLDTLQCRARVCQLSQLRHQDSGRSQWAGHVQRLCTSVPHVI